MPATSASRWPGSRGAPDETTVACPASAVCSRSRRAARPSPAPRMAASAAANPTAPATFSVPERRPCSWPPPQTSGGMRAGVRTTRQPTPLGPPSLWAESASVSAPAPRPTGNAAAACTASQWKGTPRSAAAAASRSTGCTAPVTLFAHMTAASRSPGRTRRSNSSASTTPSPPTGAHATSKPRRSSSRAGSRTAGCSMALTTSRPGGSPARPNTAWLSASDPPEVRTTWPGSAPSSSASRRRASSSPTRAARP